MKNSLIRFPVFGLMSLSACILLVMSCKKQVTHVPFVVGNPPLLQFIANNQAYSNFYYGLKKSGLSQRLSQDSAFTILLPDNTAMAYAGLSSTSAIDALGPDYLRSWVGYHIIPGYFHYSTVPDGSLEYNVKTLFGQEVFFSKRALDPTFPTFPIDLHVNGKTVVSGKDEVITNQGIIHFLDTALTAPIGTALDFIHGNKDYSIFDSLAKRFGLYTKLASPGPITVFVPTNKVFLRSRIDTTNFALYDTTTYMPFFMSAYIVPNDRLYLTVILDSPGSTTGFLYLTPLYEIFTPSGYAIYGDVLSLNVFNPFTQSNLGTAAGINSIHPNITTTNGTVFIVDGLFITPKNGLRP